MDSTQQLPPSPGGAYPARGRRINRALLLACGEHASQVAHQVLELSRRWLATPAPLQLVEMAAPGSGVEAETLPDLLAACDALVAHSLAHALRNQGLLFERPDEIHLWVVLDLIAAPPAVALAGCKPGAEPAAPAAFSDQVLPALVQTLGDQVWQRLRVAVVPHVLFLAEPVVEAMLAGWCEQMATVAANRLFLAAPVNQEHLRLELDGWHEKAATALAVLLWTGAPNHSLLEQSAPGRCTLRALGAAAWPSPAPLLKRWLALRWAQRLVTQLLRLPENGAEPLAPPPLPNAGRLEQELAATLPPPVADERWGARRPSWPALADLAQTLVRQAGQVEQEQRARQQEIRFAWLDTQLARWQEHQESRHQLQLAPTRGWPQPGRYRGELHAQRQALCRVASATDERLDAAVMHHERAGVAVEQASVRLQTLCHALPPYTAPGLAGAALQPWRWPRWAWSYWHSVPADARRLLDALAARRHAAWRESNLHLVRQFYLVTIQQTQERLAALAALERTLAELDGHLAALVEEIERALPAPWEPSRLAWLYTQLLPGQPDRAWAFLRQHPLTAWPQRDVTALAAALAAWVEPELAALDHWTAVEALHLALTAGDDEPSTAGLRWAGWLAELLHQAAPLWPGQALAPHALAEEWIATGVHPGPQPARPVQPPAAADGWRQLEAWLAARPERLRSTSKTDGLFVLRWVEVEVERVLN